jgi:hypothetical protein
VSGYSRIRTPSREGCLPGGGLIVPKAKQRAACPRPKRALTLPAHTLALHRGTVWNGYFMLQVGSGRKVSVAPGCPICGCQSSFPASS